MKYPKTFVSLIQRRLGEGAGLEQLTSALALEFGYSPQIARALIAAAQQDSAELMVPLPGVRPDVLRNEDGAALRHIPTTANCNAQVIVELVAPQVLVFKHFIPEEVVNAVRHEVPVASADKYISRNRAEHDYLLKRVGPAKDVLEAAATALNWPVERWGSPIIRDSLEGMDFELHYDQFNRESEDDARFLDTFGDNGRIGTLLVYLQAAELGGATWLANMGLRVNLNPGDAIFFGYARDNLRQSGTLHGGDAVLKGHKRIMTLFCYERALTRAAPSPTMR